MAADTVAQGEIKALLEEGEELSCLELSRVSDAVQALELDDEEAAHLYEEIERRVKASLPTRRRAVSASSP